MSREIKFRAWDKENKIMIPNIQDIYDGLEFKYRDEDGKECDIYDTNAYTQSFGYNLHNEFIEIMQFTGLLDKNGKEIFEGDIVEITGYYPEWKAKVEYGGRYKNCGFVLTGIAKFANTRVEFSNDILNESFSGPDINIIGNVYENPEVLK